LTEDQKKKVSADTVKKLEDAEKALAIVSKYSKEWVKGKWYDKKGSQTYTGIGKWKKNSKGWWFGDNLGWYAKNQWQKIDGKWYFFDKEGYMEANAYRQGYYLKANGAWDGKAKVAGWKQDSKGWWYSLGGSDFLKNGWKKIDGNWYYFKATGYIAINEFVQGWWLNKTGAWKDPVKCSWHKSGSKWWYGTMDGWYAKGKSYTIDGKKYTFDKKGYTK
jgi:glucan-binding YG repeat protein